MEATFPSTNVLLIDSDSLWCQVTASHLRRAGHTVATTADPDEGREYLKSHLVDLLVMEIKTADPDTIEPVSAVQKDRPALPLIVLAAEPSLNTAIRSIQLGVRQYLVKSLT